MVNGPADAAGNGSSETHDHHHKQRLEDLLCLFGVIDAWLEKSEYMAGAEYSIADIAVLSSVQMLQQQSSIRTSSVLDKCQNVKRWYKAVMSRRAVVAGLHQMDATSGHHP